MTEKEIAELRRRFRADKSNISRVRGCYVNEERQIISEFDQSLGMMGQEESERLLTILRKALSGTVGKNLLDLNYDTRQVTQGEEHRLLMALRNSELRDDAAVGALYRRIMQTLRLEGNYMILLAYDAYDVPYHSKDGERQMDAAQEVFRYILCAVCPVKLTKEALSYYVHEGRFRSVAADWIMAQPEAGFLFPSFDERSTNLYQTLYYTRDTADIHAELIETVLGTAAPMPAQEQLETFQTILSDTLSDDCSYPVVQAVHDHLCAVIEEHKTERRDTPLTVSRQDVGEVLRSCGVEEEKLGYFNARYESAYGADTDLSPRNLLETKRLELRTPNVTIQVDADRGDLVETRIINGARYILIRAEEGVEVNGVPVHIG